jgi:hypothetical protein
MLDAPGAVAKRSLSQRTALAMVLVASRLFSGLFAGCRCWSSVNAVRRLERIADRIVLGMLLAALVIAGGFVGSAYKRGVPGGLLAVVLLDCAAAAAAAGGGLLWLTHRKSNDW